MPRHPGRTPAAGTLFAGRDAPAEDVGEGLDLGRTYAEREIAPVAARAWHEERCPTELLRGLGELGLLSTLVPEKWGGIGSAPSG